MRANLPTLCWGGARSPVYRLWTRPTNHSIVPDGSSTQALLDERCNRVPKGGPSRFRLVGRSRASHRMSLLVASSSQPARVQPAQFVRGCVCPLRQFSRTMVFIAGHPSGLLFFYCSFPPWFCWTDGRSVIVFLHTIRLTRLNDGCSFRMKTT